MNASNPKPILLVADDEEDIGEIIEAVGEELGFEVVYVNNGSEVVALVDRLSPAVIALDLRMPGTDGVEIIRELGKKKCSSAFLLMSGMDQRTLSTVKSLGKENNLNIGPTLTKPMSIDAIENALLPYVNTQIQSESADTPNYDQDYIKPGLKLTYEPEFQLGSQKNSSAKQRLHVCMQWRKDDDSVLAREELDDWASELGIVRGLSMMALSESLEELRAWCSQGFNPEISVSIDDNSLRQLNLPDILAKLADSKSIPRELLAIEIRESAIINRCGDVADVLTRLRIKGFKISVIIEHDGENILPLIDSSPIDQLVVDMSRLSEKPNFQNDMEIEFQYSSLTSLANNKGISTCVINVDSQDHIQFMKKCNFNSARGAKILGPVAASAILTLYTEGKFSEELKFVG